MAHIDGEIDLLALDDFELALVLLHVDGHELVADFRSVFRRVNETKLALLEYV